MTNGLRLTTLMLGVSSLLSLSGCTWFGGGEGGGALQPDRFDRQNPPGTILSRHQLTDEHQPLYNQVRVVEMDPNSPQNAKIGVRTGIGDQPLRPEETVTSVSKASVELAERRPTGVAPATRPLNLETTGGFMTVGSVVATVNGSPIYADKIVARLAPALAASAKRSNVDQYKNEASKLLHDELIAQVRNELVYAEAEKAVEAKEKDLADNLTLEWRRKTVIENGGSIEQTRAFFAAQGQDFDEALKDKYREYVVAIYYQKKIFPKVQVTADDMRRYYDRNKDKVFSATEQATFRLIKIDSKAVGSKDDALKRATEIRERLSKGEDFELLSTQFNADTRLKAAGGLETPIRRGEYANTNVEDAVFATPAGKITPVIEAGNALYIAKVEQKTEGRIRPFEDPAVQQQIKETLRKQQMGPMIDMQQSRLRAAAIIRPDPPRIEPLMEMALQLYPAWAGK